MKQITAVPGTVIPESWIETISRADLPGDLKHAALAVAWIALDQGLPVVFTRKTRQRLHRMLDAGFRARAVVRGTDADLRRTYRSLVDLRDLGFLSVECRNNDQGAATWHSVSLTIPARTRA